MTRTQRIAIAAGAGAAAIVAAVLIVRHLRSTAVKSLTGVALRQAGEVRNQTPLAHAQVTLADGAPAVSVTTNSSGLFRLSLPGGYHRGDRITLEFRQPGYKPLDLETTAGNQIYVARLLPEHPPAPTPPESASIVVGNVRVRYAVASTSIVNVGSAVKIFAVANQGNIRCGGSPCSPDGKWKAAISGATLDAGGGNEFQGARVSCIAGPCPFTKIEKDDFSVGGRKIGVVIRNWSDTTEFLMEAEVVHPLISDQIRESYPAIFGRTLNFSLPAAAEGASFEAEIGGTDIIYPLGPMLSLSWTTCHLQTSAEGTKTYACELNPGYRFR